LHSFESLLQKSNTVEAGHCDPRIWHESGIIKNWKVVIHAC
jgi:hypothetical protein